MPDKPRWTWAELFDAVTSFFSDRAENLPPLSPGEDDPKMRHSHAGWGLYDKSDWRLDPHDPDDPNDTH